MSYQLALSPHLHQQFWSCSAVDNILFKYCINLRSLRIFSNHQHCPTLFPNYQRRDFWSWYGFDFVAGLLISKSPTPGFLADCLILLPLFRISGPALVWTLVVDCGGLAWPGSEHHRCWTWIPPGGWSYFETCQIILRNKCLSTQQITSYC